MNFCLLTTDGVVHCPAQGKFTTSMEVSAIECTPVLTVRKQSAFKTVHLIIMPGTHGLETIIPADGCAFKSLDLDLNLDLLFLDMLMVRSLPTRMCFKSEVYRLARREGPIYL